jgi:transcriptional regulator with XRE-family HTH domain
MSFVIQYSFPTSLPWTEKLVAKLSQPKYRHAYMMNGVTTWIARQVRALREQRGWSQEDLGQKTKKPQSAISRVEDPDYGKLTLNTLFDLARAYDLPLLVQFVEWSDWLSRMNDSSTEGLQKESFSAEALTDVGKGQIFIEPKREAVTAPSSGAWATYSANTADIVTRLSRGAWVTYSTGNVSDVGGGTTVDLGPAATGLNWLTGTAIKTAAPIPSYGRLYDPLGVGSDEDDGTLNRPSFGRVGHVIEAWETDNG